MHRPFHPLLFAVFPVMFLFRQNFWGLEGNEIILPIFGTLGAVAVLQVAASLLTRKPRKVAMVLSVLTLLFFSYGHVYGVVVDGHGELWDVDGDIALGAIWIAIAVATITLVARTRRKLRDGTRIFNVFAVALLVTIALPLALTLVTDGSAAGAAEAGTARLAAGGQVREPKRDIYYLVFDRYAGQRSLKELFGNDNREFLGHLEDRGFEISESSRANYQATVPSLAASLNMRYLDWIAESLEGQTRSTRPMYKAIGENEVVRFLRSQGYRYVHVGSRWDMTRESPIADVNIRLDGTSEFTRVFFGSTALLPAMHHGILLPAPTDNTRSSRAFTLRQLDATIASARLRGPKFVFSHFGLPHPPYVFDRNGQPMDDRSRTVPGKARAYFQQLQYTNTRIKQIVDTLLDAPRGQEPIIIIQADEGPYPSFSWVAPKQWWKTTDRKLRTKFDILMATHMPGLDQTDTYEEMSPVNVFRVVLNNYFGADLPMLPDRSFVPTHKDTLYEWTEITDRLNTPIEEFGPPLYPPRVPALPDVRRTT